ncbi:hypothetical protein PLICRDRAFT_549534 [Plicaturopsis crispa FD-325 SS-3]|nr:hypothetical protein PLICRDRAFT_549534 [Plicaturopsis crispa FD-325 SS-3]
MESPSPRNSHFIVDRDDDGDDADTASQRSISLSSPADSPRHSAAIHHDDTVHTGSILSALPKSPPAQDPPLKRESHPYTLDTDFSSDADDGSLYTHDIRRESSVTSATTSDYEEPKTAALPPTYPPVPSRGPPGDTGSVTSLASGASKARPESMLLEPPKGPLVLGIALVDFNHVVGPKIEFSKGDIFEDEELVKILPFLALPDGAHLSTEDYSYFHLVPSSPNPSTIFGISCNRQIASSELLVKDVDVTRSTVQKAVVILASKPVFGPIRDKLGVVTRALFNQKDFRETDILVDFMASLEISLRSQLTESGLYMGTSLRELIHTFRQRTLVLVKALMLQKRIMFYGHPVERLCTYQYSLISLLPGLLQTLDDCGSPPLAARAPTLSKPSSLRTSDHKSMMAYMGLPLDIFGKDAFFQPYLPLQQLDMIKETKSWLCGSTNSIVTQQKEIDLLVNTETGTFEFRDPQVERSSALTAADRKWMDDIVKDVNDGWNEEDPTRPLGIFKGSDDYLRSKFEEYVSAALASVKYRDFVSKGEGAGVMITGGSGGDANSTEDFNPLWISEFKQTNAYEVWNRITDPLLFDIVEPRHPCNEKPSVVADIGLRLQEGIQELKLEQQLAPTREAINRTITAGQANFFSALQGVRGRWTQRSSPSTTDVTSASTSSSTIVDVSKSDGESSSEEPPVPAKDKDAPPPAPPAKDSPARPLSVAAAETKAAVGAWGAGIGSFWSTRAARFSLPRASRGSTESSQPSRDASPAPAPPVPASPDPAPAQTLSPTLSPPPAATPLLAAISHSETEVPAVPAADAHEELEVKDLDSVHHRDSIEEPAGMAL